VIHEPSKNKVFQAVFLVQQLFVYTVGRVVYKRQSPTEFQADMGAAWKTFRQSKEILKLFDKLVGTRFD